MGLPTPLAKFLAREHSIRPLGPDVLFIGRQTIPLSLEALNTILGHYGLTNRAPGEVEYDRETRGTEGKSFITDRYFMKSLGVNKFHALDVTDYEGADIVWDLGEAIPEKYYGKYDLIYNGSCLDNMFNPGVALMNLSKLLKLNGRMINIENASSWNDPYLIFSPGWFYDFYVSNNYKHCEIYLISYKDNDELYYGPWEMQFVNVPSNTSGAPPEVPRGIHLVLLTIAEKGDNSTDTVQPVQSQFRATKELQEAFRRSEASLQAASRPLVNGQTIDPANSPYLVDVGRFGLGLDRPESERQRQVGGVASFRLAELLCSTAKVLTPLAKLLPAISNLVRRIDQAGIDMWNRAESNLVQRADQTGIDMWNRAKIRRHSN
jgi:hypothetical protein